MLVFGKIIVYSLQSHILELDTRGVLDDLAHRLLVNCVLPVREKHGLESMAMYINNVDYYQPDKSKVLSPAKIAIEVLNHNRT